MNMQFRDLPIVWSPSFCFWSFWHRCFLLPRVQRMAALFDTLRGPSNGRCGTFNEDTSAHNNEALISVALHSQPLCNLFQRISNHVFADRQPDGVSFLNRRSAEVAHHLCP